MTRPTDSDESDDSAARAAYAAYAKAVEGRTFRGEQMLDFDELPPQLQFAWREAASAVPHSPSSTEHQKPLELSNNPAPQITREQYF